MKLHDIFVMVGNHVAAGFGGTIDAEYTQIF